jgi:hypothetical protein
MIFFLAACRCCVDEAYSACVESESQQPPQLVHHDFDLGHGSLHEDDKRHFVSAAKCVQIQ